MSSHRVPVTYLLSNFRGPFNQTWVQRTQVRLRKSSCVTCKDGATNWGNSGLGDLAISICTKAEILAYALERLDTQWGKIRNELARKEKAVRVAMEADCGFGGLDHDDVIVVLLDFDSFIFEAKSFLDYLATFLSTFYAACFDQKLNRKNSFETIESLFAAQTDLEVWTRILKTARDELIHRRAPWPEIELDDALDSKSKYNFVILRRGTTMNEEGAEAYSAGDIGKIVNGFSRLAELVEKHLFNEIKKRENQVNR